MSAERSIPRHAGFTIVEAVVTIVVLSIALASVAALLQLGTQAGADVLQQTRAMALGQAYLDEILGRRFDEKSLDGPDKHCFSLAPPWPCTLSAAFGPDAGETAVADSRAAFDDVDDYHGWREGFGEAVTRTIRDTQGNTRSNYDNFHVAIDVAYAGNDSVWALADATNAKFIKVTVTLRGQNQGWIFSAYKGNY